MWPAKAKSIMNEQTELQKGIATIVSCLVVIVIVAGCASTKVTNREQLVTGKLARPTHIWVCNFTATASDIPAESSLSGEADVDTTSSQTPEQIAEGKKLGAEIAEAVAKRFATWDCPARWRCRGPSVRSTTL